MIQSTKEIAEELNCRYELVNQYLCRGEFHHIKRYRIGNRYMYENITDNDKKLLKYYIDKARKRSGRKKCI